MPERLPMRALCLILLLPLVTIGCGLDRRLPTAVAPPSALTSVASNPEGRDERLLETMRDRRLHHRSPRALIAEAREGLGAVLAGEQAYFQVWTTFTDVPATADFRVTLGVDLGDLLHRWTFSVNGASATGFIAKAQGRSGTDAAGITVTLSYERGQPIVWAVQRRRPRR